MKLRFFEANRVEKLIELGASNAIPIKGWSHLRGDAINQSPLFVGCCGHRG